MSEKQAKIWCLIIVIGLIFGISYAICTSKPTLMTKKQEIEAEARYWNSLTPAERRNENQ